ncbi:TetR family transcriptional regulator [Nocardia salmonicida]|uniref:TetR family transcriptional regulator n=1 Tax=Nocardia salmonicida TaxID=53431 RepID=UPI003661E9F6
MFARNAEATRRRVLDAATVEFAAYGLAGGRTARIARTAGTNQRMIYAYFESKDGLFDAVLQHHITAAQHAITFDAGDLPGYAQRVFDFYRANPAMVRLAMWQSLERPGLMASLPEVVTAMREKIEAIEQAQQEGCLCSAVPAHRLLDQILTLAHGNIADAAHPECWTDQHRRDLGVAVATLAHPERAVRTAVQQQD